MISQEKFDQIEIDYDCGYWLECCERCCPCAITTESKGLTQEIWDGFKKEQKELRESIDKYEPREFDFMEEDWDEDDDCELYNGD
ncbi:MAG: hypothetical protein ACREV6_19555 [Clostridium sp.]|uniref:hypothetical protein n=1 Tax=Clostridium sp. TaxID=1506 RepID=UPI003D6D0157